MGGFKRVAFISLFVIASLVIAGLGLRAFSQEKDDLRRVSFSAQEGLLNFFDPSSGMVYMYSEATGRLMATYKITKLGQNLERTEEKRIIVY